MSQVIKVLSIRYTTRDVINILTEKPIGIDFLAGQAANISIHKTGWEHEIRTYAITSTPEDDHFEFNIKIYQEQNGMGFLNQITQLQVGDEFLFHSICGTVTYQGEGVFIAGGAGITPFISMLRSIQKQGKIGNNHLIYANRTQADIIEEDTLQSILGKQYIGILSEEKRDGYEFGFISKELIERLLTDNSQYFYLCGPLPMTNMIEKYLEELGVSEEQIVIERF
ncbi:MAG: flavodoxin reductase [Brumimicrobium sp.]|nr:flavodoxin reductase [Brumimicrobium sp.]MCO5267804.1 FAD-binding oxidoreductase [Brumimicrobium sp.]